MAGGTSSARAAEPSWACRNGARLEWREERSGDGVFQGTLSVEGRNGARLEWREEPELVRLSFACAARAAMEPALNGGRNSLRQDLSVPGHMPAAMEPA